MKVLVKNENICIECHQCEETCAKAFFKSPDISKSSIKVQRDKSANINITTCTQCGECIDVCPVLAISRDKNGIVRIDKQKCVGCFMCVGACNEGAMMYNRDFREPFKCVSCGLCTRNCPTGAIVLEEVSG
jgi:Fe-S-cluster-containing hydrogenase component 2